MDQSFEMQGFSKLSYVGRIERLFELGAIGREDIEFLTRGGLQQSDLAEKFIENAIGYLQIPLGIATNFRIDGRDYVIPMAVEETSIIAAASKTAKWIKEFGEITTSSIGNEIIGQIQIAQVQNFAKLHAYISQNEKHLVASANSEVAFGLVRRGGGVKALKVRELDREDGSGSMAVIHVTMDPCDAMGANIINQVCEFLKKPIELATDEQVTMCILSNLADTRLTRARVVLRGLDPHISRRITEASLFATLDPYRAATHNKGVLNGIDPIVLATGNDWRAVEAGVHAYAARSGQYRAISRWFMQDDELIGELTAPLVVGTVGGMTGLHPTARLCLKILRVTSAEALSRILAAVGLVQNLGALRALTSEGIIAGHMKLHIRNFTLAVGAEVGETPLLQARLEKLLAKTKKVSLQDAVVALADIRRQVGEATP